MKVRSRSRNVGSLLLLLLMMDILKRIVVWEVMGRVSVCRFYQRL